MKKLVLVMMVLMTFVATSAFAVTYTIDDNWIKWPGYDSSNAEQNRTDHLGSPDVLKMEVTVSDLGMLENIDLYFDSDPDLIPHGFDNLFINSYNLTTTGENWDSWDYVVHSGGSDAYYSNRMTGTPILVDGLYSVSDNYQYTKTAEYNGRFLTPNGIDADFANLEDSSLTGVYDTMTSVKSYDFLGQNIDVTDGFFVAWSPWCANDVIGGSPVPEPATLLLLGSGILGLGLIRRFRK